ncbi:MAG: hypothetical protein EA357_02395 [Micavibrio sp.]|nr:MAG: hypothetical protein EA357_02395 [Micavibrio sp.]
MVKIIGHRGLRHDKKTDENTLAAFRAAFQNADGIETDISLSKDGTPFLVHDLGHLNLPRLRISRTINMLRYCLDRASAKKTKGKRLGDLSDKEIAALRLKKGGKMPRLSNLFALAAKYPGKTIDLELKGAGAVKPVLDEIDRAVKKGQITRAQIVLTSFDHTAIAEAAKLAPDIKRGIIFAGRRSANTPIYPWTGDKTRRYVPFSESAVKSKEMKAAAPDFAVMHTSMLGTKNIAALKSEFPQMRIAVWDSSKKPPEKNKTLKKALADPQIAPHIAAVITDYPQKAAAMLRKKPQKKP